METILSASIWRSNGGFRSGARKMRHRIPQKFHRNPVHRRTQQANSKAHQETWHAKCCPRRTGNERVTAPGNRPDVNTGFQDKLSEKLVSNLSHGEAATSCFHGAAKIDVLYFV
ncbi:hypothetical protein PIB30_058011 [Stylosanthes scabra]|uniref:Uncharacterized protein n=1 Tax=Stylosanthes scabra TaxID=79078 RepID=A0ABU6ZII8_9FABA|nr:hypothetical protein [Stylosanthes scabra]